MSSGERAELHALSKEKDPELFFEGLLAFGGRMEALGRLDQAAQIYSTLQTPHPLPLGERESLPGIQRRARQRLDALTGHGSGGLRAEVLLRGFSDAATDYRMIVPMFAGTLVGQVTQATLLGRLLGTARAGWWTRGTNAMVMSRTGGFIAEVHAFAGMGHLLSGGTGSFDQHLQNAGISLGAMKLAGWGMQKLGKVAGQGPALGYIHTAGMFGGLLAAHRIEVGLGLRPGVDGATTMTDTLGAMLSLAVGAHLGRSLLGSPIAGLQKELALRLEGRYRRAAEPPMSPWNTVFSTQATQAQAMPSLDPVSPSKAMELNTFMVARPSGKEPSSDSLRGYQKKMLKALKSDLEREASPWLGLASPMQTGKSYLIGPIVRLLEENFASDCQFFILSSARIITDQILKDMESQFEAKIGRFDGYHKEIKRITVASATAMAKHLDKFSTDVPTVLINDEAYSTQAETFRKIYTHFGLGEIQEIDGSSRLVPKRGNGLVVGLSGTGGGLEGYHVSDQLNLLEAIELGAIRQMWGERVVIDIPSQHQRIPGEEYLVWWEPTSANAKALVDLYAKKIHDFFPKSMVFVPTIEHGELFLTALRERFGESFAHLAHSRMADRAFLDSLQNWERDGGPLVSIKRIGRGFRGTGTLAVFHTYQTTSPELYAQRTGRAWGKVDPLPDLYVLEVSWKPRSSFANLARLLGLIDYPGATVNSRKLKPLLRKQRERREAEENLQEEVRLGRISPVFVGIPLEERWRRRFMELVNTTGGIAELSAKTQLDTEVLAGFALGALPVRLPQIERLEGFLGGEYEAKKIWVQAWQRALEESLGGRSRLQDDLLEELVQWKNNYGQADDASAVSEAAGELDRILEKNLRFLGSRILRRKSLILPVKSEDMGLLKEAYVHLRSAIKPELMDGHNPSPVQGWTHQELALRLDPGIMSDSEWRKTWLGITQTLQRISKNPTRDEETRAGARQRLELLIRHFFRRQSWGLKTETAAQRLLYQARRAVALRFGSSLPLYSELQGVANHEHSLVQGWLEGETPSTPKGRVLLFRQIRNLFHALGYDASLIRSYLVPAVFESKGWPWSADGATERLIRETRYWIAAKLDGSVPQGPISDWVNRNVNSEDNGKEPFLPYPTFTRFLLDLKAPIREVLSLIHASALEESDRARGWKEKQTVRRSYLATLLWLQMEYPGFLPSEGHELFLGPNPHEEALETFADILGPNLESSVQKVLGTLTPREERVVQMLYGMEGFLDSTHEEIGQDFEVTSERIRQIQAKAFRKLRHRSRSKHLRTFLSNGEQISKGPVSAGLYLTFLHMSYKIPGMVISPEKTADSIVRHLAETRYQFPNHYPFLLAKIFQEHFLAGIDSMPRDPLDPLILKNLSLNPGEIQLLRFPHISEDIRFFLGRQFAEVKWLREEGDRIYAKFSQYPEDEGTRLEINMDIQTIIEAWIKEPTEKVLRKLRRLERSYLDQLSKASLIEDHQAP